MFVPARKVQHWDLKMKIMDYALNILFTDKDGEIIID